MSELSKLPGDSSPRLHSEDQFGPQRDFWWNEDFLPLLARRWRLHEASSLADVFEQAAELREVGSGLTVWAGAIRALEQLGVAERVLAKSSKTERFEVRCSSPSLSA